MCRSIRIGESVLPQVAHPQARRTTEGPDCRASPHVPPAVGLLPDVTTSKTSCKSLSLSAPLYTGSNFILSRFNHPTSDILEREPACRGRLGKPQCWPSRPPNTQDTQHHTNDVDFPYSPKCSTLANVGRSDIYKNKKDYSEVRKIHFFTLTC